MSLTKTEQKTGLILLPDKVLSDNLILESLHIKKSNGILEYKSRDLDDNEITKYYSNLPAQARHADDGQYDYSKRCGQ